MDEEGQECSASRPLQSGRSACILQSSWQKHGMFSRPIVPDLWNDECEVRNGAAVHEG
jgi:hypothetical protein